MQGAQAPSEHCSTLQRTEPRCGLHQVTVFLAFTLCHPQHQSPLQPRRATMGCKGARHVRHSYLVG
eukprot:1150099-Pelagomonas_calceolata.AAC.6